MLTLGGKNPYIIPKPIQINDVIADQSGSGGTGSNAGAGALDIVAGPTGVTLAADNTYTGGTTLEASSQLTLSVAMAAGTGAITFAPTNGQTTILELGSQAQPIGNTPAGFGNGDELDLAGYRYSRRQTQVFYNSNQHTLTVEEVLGTGIVAGPETFHLENEVPDSLGQVDVSSDGNGGTIVDNVATCFLPGSAILTPDGEVPVERLRPGMAVSVLEHSVLVTRTVRWIGRGWSEGRDPAALDRHPVRFRAGSIRNGVPTRDLLVTAEHCVLLDGGLVPARMLVNGASIVADEAITSFEFFHVELDRHGILLAEGLEVESYLDTGNRANFRGGAVTTLRPSFEVEADHSAWSTDAAAPLTVAREAVEPIWRQLAARAAAMGFVTPGPATLVAEPDVHLVTDTGLRLDAVFRDGIAHGFVVPAGTTALRLVSRASRPSDIVGPFLDDRRMLGVQVSTLTVAGGGRRFTSNAHLSSEPLSGWHTPEGGGTRRWTDGAAVLPLDISATDGKAMLLTLEIVAAGPYLAVPTFAGTAEGSERRAA